MWMHGDIFQIPFIHKIFNRRTHIRRGKTYVGSEHGKGSVADVQKGVWKGTGIVFSGLFTPLLQFTNYFFAKFIQKHSPPFPPIVARWDEEKQESPHEAGGKEEAMDELKKIPTNQLVEELVDRDGVEKIVLQPYQKSKFEAEGPAVVLMVTD